MGLLDGLLGQVAGNVNVQDIAQKVGLPADQVEAAIAALGQAHPQPGDTAETASAATGLPAGKLQEIIGQMGGEGVLGQVSGLLGGLGSNLFGRT